MLAGLNRYLAEPIEDCLAVDDDGSPLIEVHSPIDLEHELGLPRGNIFQRALSWPFRQDDEPVRWGVETPLANVLLCGAGAQRGGGVSGIPGYHAAARVLAAG
jgi:phytoene dehydrogenase-like protein